MRTSTAVRAGAVLLIEENETMRHALAIRLRRAGFRVRSVADAGAAAAQLARMRFDVVTGDAAARKELALPDAWTGAFALLRKPLDFEEAVRVVTAASTAKAPLVDLGALQRFVASVPALRDTLTAPMASPQELLLRGELRRTVSELSGMLEAAAQEESNRSRAAVFQAASTMAAELAAGRVSSPSSAGH